MSAIPIPIPSPRAGAPGAALDRPYFAPVPFDPLLDRACDDRRLAALDVRLLGWLRKWVRLHPGIWPTQAQGAAAMECDSTKTIARSLDRLCAAGYLSFLRRQGRGASLIMVNFAAPPLVLAAGPTERQATFFAESAQPSPVKWTPESTLPDSDVRLLAGSPPLTLSPGNSESSKTTTPVVESSYPLDPQEIEKLNERASRLVPGATPGRVAQAAQDFSAEWLSRALDEVERHNRTPGNKRVWSWGFVLNTLRNFKVMGGPPPKAAPDEPAKSLPKEPPKTTDPEPPVRLSADELADQIAVTRLPGRAGRIGLDAIRIGLREGAFGEADLPADVLDLLRAKKRRRGHLPRPPRRRTQSCRASVRGNPTRPKPSRQEPPLNIRQPIPPVGVRSPQSRPIRRFSRISRLIQTSKQPPSAPEGFEVRPTYMWII